MGDEQAIQVSDLDEGDFGLLKSLVLSRGELYAAALACKLISQRCHSPIETADHLLDAVLEGPGSFVDLGEHSVSFEDAKTYLTRDLFPIENDGDLTTKLLLVLIVAPPFLPHTRSLNPLRNSPVPVLKGRNPDVEAAEAS